MAGFVAANILKGDVETINWNEIEALDRSRNILGDLRNKDELDATGTIEGSVNIPINELRQRLPELDKSRNYIPYCAAGMRGYIGHRILVQQGFKSKSLSGGYKTYNATRKNTVHEAAG